VILELLEATGRLQEFGAIVYVLYSVWNELRWRPHEDRGAWRAPGIIGLIGAISLLRTLTPDGTTLDFVLVAAAIVIACAAGAVSASVARFRPLQAETRQRLLQRAEHRRGRAGGTPATLPTHETKTGWIGAVTWLAALGGRWVVEAIAEEAHSPLAETVGLGLLIVALTEAARLIVLQRRSNKPQTADPAAP